MKKYITTILLTSVCSVQAILAQTNHIHLSFASSNTKDKAATITWTNTHNCNSVLKFGLDSLSLKSEIKVSPKLATGQKNWFVYSAELQKLRAGQVYYYSIVPDSQCTKEAAPTINRFTTQPKNGATNKFTVGVWGDTQNNEGNRSFEVTGKIVDRLLKYPLDFTIHTGDIVENGSVVSSWDNFLKTSQPLNVNVPFMPSTGNHDVVNAAQDANFQKPFPIYFDLFNLPEDELNYSFDYGNTHFVAINSGYCAGAAKVDKVLFKKDSPEYKWLENDLEKAKKNKKIKWIILYDHYPVHAHGVSLVPQWQNQISTIIDKYKIDLVLSGHRHVYERHAAIANGVVSKPDDPNVYYKPKGTVFITNGSAGGSLQGIGGASLPSMLFTSKEKMYTYAIMSVHDNEIGYDVYNIDGVKIDHFKLIK